MRYLTIEQREKLEAALNARAAQLRASIAEALDAEGDGGRSLPNHMQETDDEAVADMETSMDVAHLSRDVLDLAQPSALWRSCTHPTTVLAPTAASTSRSPA